MEATPTHSTPKSVKRSISQPPEDSNTPSSSILSTGHPTKRRKLTPGEKVLEEQAKQEKRAEKEAEKKAVADERAKKKEVKEKERAEREAAKKALADARARRAQRIEQSQLRITTMFNIPGASPPAAVNSAKTLKAPASPSKYHFMTKEEARRRSMSLSLEPTESLPAVVSPSLVIKSNEAEQDKYESAVRNAKKNGTEMPEPPKEAEKEWVIRPFYVRKHAKLAPQVLLLSDPEHWAHVKAITEILDTYDTNHKTYKPSTDVGVPSLCELVVKQNIATPRGFDVRPLRELIASIQGPEGTPSTPINPTAETQEKIFEVQSLVTKKYIEDDYDVRPRYCGSWTKPLSRAQGRGIALNPRLYRLEGVDYDYDSEAEWVPDDGEDVDTDGENDEKDKDEKPEEDEFAEFIDDNDDTIAGGQMGNVPSNQQPISSGLHFQNASGALERPDGGEPDHFSQYEMQWLIPIPAGGTIDPYTDYWSAASAAEAKQVVSTGNRFLNPMRLPLQDLSSSGVNYANIRAGIVIAPKAITQKPKKDARMIPTEHMQRFEEAIKHSNLSKHELLESLKKKFPSLKSVEIADTLDEVAEKRWVLKREMLP